MNGEETYGITPLEGFTKNEKTMIKLTMCESQFLKGGFEESVPH